jgi:hypothetical protein
LPLLKGWEIDLRALYGRKWRDKEKWHLGEDLWESPDGRLAGLLYRIAEVGVSKEVGRLAVFRNKERPELVVNLPNLECWYLHRSGVQFGAEGILFVHRFKSGFRGLGVRICALDVTARALCPMAQLEENFYETRWIDQKRYGFRKMSLEGGSEETVIDLSGLAWKSISWIGRWTWST